MTTIRVSTNKQTRSPDATSLTDPILRGWVNYFAVGHSSRCFSYIRDWVEKKIRCHLARASKPQGFGWKRWSREWLYGTLGLFHEYRVAYQPSSWAAAPSR
jgi:RNA-directed DNA polymerase